MFTLLGRVGLAYGPVLPYLTGGLAVSNLRYGYEFRNANVSLTLISLSKGAQRQAALRSASPLVLASIIRSPPTGRSAANFYTCSLMG